MSSNTLTPTIVISGATKEFFISRESALTHRAIVPALNNVNLTVRAGEKIGLIGRNGAGKTTLLRAIGGTCPLNRGSIRCASAPRMVLSLIQSFLPHLTGRENIYLFGSIIGLLKSEIKDLEGEIINFSGLESVIDEPLRQYSAGMKARLAFAVATAGEPAILCLDEILSVGDSAFVKKAFERLQKLGQKSSIIIASHDLYSLKNFATRLILLENGSVVADGQPETVIKQYEQLIGR